MLASIIIPTFNRLWALPATIASCPNRGDIEIIVVDDGSTDGTWAWLELQSGVRAIRQTNWGKGAAANRAFEAARGTYVRFLDSDDLLISDEVEKQLDYIVREDADICVAGYLASYLATGEQVLHEWRDCGDFLAQQLGECDSSHYSAYWFRREFLPYVRHRPEFELRDDRMFILECALLEPKVVAHARPTLIHQHHDRGRVQFQPGSTQVVTNWQELRMFRKIADLLEQRGELTDRRKAAIANNLWPLALRIAAYNRREALGVLAWLQALNPRFQIPNSGVGRLHRTVGFAVAQSVVNTARGVRNVGRGLAGTFGR